MDITSWNTGNSFAFSLPFRSFSGRRGANGIVKIKSKRVALISLLAALYAVLSYLPISIFIGGEALITANIIILPLIVYVLDFSEAVVTSVIGALAMFFTNTAIAPVYGPFAILIPVIGVVFGSLSKKISVASLPWIIFGVISYVLYSGGNLLYLSLYAGGIFVSILAVKSSRFKTINCCVSTTLCELIAMDIGCIYLLDFPSELWIIILPFAVYERTVAVLGSTSLIKGFTRYVIGMLAMKE